MPLDEPVDVVGHGRLLPTQSSLIPGGRPSFVQRLIDVSIKLGPITAPNQPLSFFAQGGANTVTLSGHRASVRIQQSGGISSHADIHVWGLNQTLMNELSQLGIVYDQIRQNSILVTAGDSTSGMSAVYGGTIFHAFGEYNQTPEVPMVFECASGLAESVISTLPTTFGGTTSVATLMQAWANLMGKQFENNDVNVQCQNPYYDGNVWTQVQECASENNVTAQLVDGGGTLAIWPRGGSRTSLEDVPLISPETGMIGYPTFSPGSYAIIKHIYNPKVRLGGTIEVESSIPLAKRRWDVLGLDLVLESLVPGGHWMGIATCYPHVYSKPAPPPPKGV